MNARQRVDASTTTYLPVCSCGWRGHLRVTLSGAWSEAADHASYAHRDARQAIRSRSAAQIREARRARG